MHSKLKKTIFFCLFLFTGWTLHAQVERMEPPCWWAGMVHPHLQLMVYGNNLAGTTVTCSYKGVELVAVASADNPNYIFIDLMLAPDIQPGTIEFIFKDPDGVQFTYPYTLQARKPGSANREGFNNGDVLYLIMPDRFANGDPSNDEKSGMKEGLDRIEPYGRHGGDIKGIMDHLDYISDMGFTAIWLNPVLENDQPQWSYHGYATTDFYKVDARFGTNEDYRALSEMAQEKGIKMVMDMIFNHCGSEHWWMKDMPMNNWINRYPDYQVTNHRRTTNMDPHASEFDRRLMTEGWFVPTMPDMNLDHPFMANYLIQNSIWWIEYAGLAGIRMDTYPYPDKYAMAEWNRRILKEYPELNMVGEEWSLNPAIVSYWQRGQQNFDGYNGSIPSMLDFPLQSAVQRALMEEESWGTGWVTLYEMLANDFLYPDPDNLVIFPDNHDMPRFFMQLEMDVDLYKLGIVYFLTTRGIPQIFYGSEILMTHTEGNDHGHIRKDFPGGWENDTVNAFTGNGMSQAQKDIQAFFKELLQWRKNSKVIHSGRLTHYAPVDGTYTYFRHDDQDAVMIVFNKNETKYTLDLARFNEILKDYTTGTDILSKEKYNLYNQLVMGPKSVLILDLK